MIEYSVQTDGCVLTVLVVPRASRAEISGEHDGALKVKVTAPPVDGAANEQLIQVLAKYFDVAKSSIAILSGSTTRRKQVKVSCSEPALKDKLATLQSRH